MRRTALHLTPLLLLQLMGCAGMQHRSSISRSFQSRFGCPADRISRVADGYHVEGCERSAEYVCFTAPDAVYHYGQRERERYGRPNAGDAIGGVLIAAAIGSASERCVLASSERFAPHAVASDAPGFVGRARQRDGRAVLKTRVLFAGGNLRALAAPREHPEEALLIFHSVARLSDAPCQAELFHDGVSVPVLQLAREGAYEARLAVPIRALDGVQDAVRFAGSVCGLDFELDPAGRSTLGAFAARCREERAQLLASAGGEHSKAETAKESPAPAPPPNVPVTASPSLPPASPSELPEPSSPVSAP